VESGEERNVQTRRQDTEKKERPIENSLGGSRETPGGKAGRHPAYEDTNGKGLEGRGHLGKKTKNIETKSNAKSRGLQPSRPPRG